MLDFEIYFVHKSFYFVSVLLCGFLEEIYVFVSEFFFEGGKVCAECVECFSVSWIVVNGVEVASDKGAA